MKKNIKIASLLYLFSSISLTACPTCVGRINQESPLFFSNEFYQTNSESMDQLYEQIMQEQTQTEPAQEQINQKEEQ